MSPFKSTTSHGCLPGSGVLALFVSLLVIILLGAFRGGELFSPGKLNEQAGNLSLNGVNSHAEIEHCATCHVPYWSEERISDRCLLCHTELTQNEQNFHLAMITQGKSSTCLECHTEHNGPNSELTRFDINAFPHDRSGFALASHKKNADGSTFSCIDCHASFLVFDPGICRQCHEELDATFIQSHIAGYSGDCLGCHDGIETYGKNFDHNRTSFPLSGTHASLGCQDCHQSARTMVELRNTPQDCYGCHQADDPHVGRFGQDCGACHTAEGWEEATFDHSLSVFPLTGAHLDVGCEECHQNNSFRGTPQACEACHQEPDFHSGTLDSNCESCHSTESWSPAKFNMAHAFPLDHGEGGISDCKICHPNTVAAYTCYGCHEHNQANIESEHEDEGIGDFQDCVRCHATGEEEGEFGGGREGGESGDD